MKVDAIWNALDNKLIAILRGIKPEETEAIVLELLEAGFRSIEIPLNSPDPFRSIEIAANAVSKHSADPCLIGAGTVIKVDEVNTVSNAGGNMIVSPNVDQTIINATKQLGMFSAPGVYTATECLVALQAGADCLKIFPASNLGVDGVKALSAVLQSGTQICAVGGVGPEEFKQYLNAGASGFGLGSSLYKPGMSPSDVGKLARLCVAVYRRTLNGT